ncbi:MFS transporter [Rhizobium sp. L1K21]|uniref:MFS transporter n=1 Tax=Rhizobium sp. L1K21 TaxID=2954933 RepID=UPI0020936DF0|nr:MFS transporter [Rhizobium sp. L1K21]MCO6188108.1 MFS transporter [Rhizobium sp. L1K21]
MDIADNITRPAIVTRERIAISTLFLMNGLLIGTWASKIPVFAERLSLTPGTMGVMIFFFGIGSLVLMPVAGAQIARIGSARATKISTVLLLPLLLLVNYAPNIWLAAVALVLFGGLSGAMDICMNANAVETEKFMRRSIMSSCHAFWSVGTFIGASSGGWLIANLGPDLHAWLITAATILLFIVALTGILQDKPHKTETEKGGRFRLPLSPLPWMLGLMALFSMVPEGAVLDWSGLYLNTELGASLAVSSLAFGMFSFTMAIMRFAGDFIRDRFGAVRTFRFCTVTAMIGLVLAGLAPSQWIALVGFAITGIGISNMVPIAFSAAGNLPGFSQGVALSITSFLGYSGILFAPSVIGFVAEHTSFSTVYVTLPVFLVGVLVLSGLARHADSVKDGVH